MYGILHERRCNPLVAVIRMRHHAIDTAYTQPGRSHTYRAFKQCITSNIRFSEEGSTKLVMVKIGIKREEALSLSSNEIKVFIGAKYRCVEAKKRFHLGR